MGTRRPAAAAVAAALALSAPGRLSRRQPARRHQRRDCACVGDLIYRHACLGCGHVDQPHDQENAAVEDAMDHAWTGWRDLPVLACSMPEDKKQQQTWLAQATQHYPDRMDRGRWPRPHRPLSLREPPRPRPQPVCGQCVLTILDAAIEALRLWVSA